MLRDECRVAKRIRSAPRLVIRALSIRVAGGLALQVARRFRRRNGTMVRAGCVDADGEVSGRAGWLLDISVAICDMSLARQPAARRWSAGDDRRRSRGDELLDESGLCATYGGHAARPN